MSLTKPQNGTNMAGVNLTKAVRANLLSLQSTAAQMSKTQERLATGLKVNSALDNPTNFFTAASLNSRASDMGNLLDSISNGISTIEAADNGLKSITKTVESMQSTLRQARQDKAFKSQSYAIDSAATGLMSFSGGAVGATAVDVSLGSGGAVQSVVSASADYQSPAGSSGSISFTFAANPVPWGGSDTMSFDLEVDGVSVPTMDLDIVAVLSVGNADSIIDDGNELAAAMNYMLQSNGQSGAVQASFDGTSITLTSIATTGPTSTINVLGFDADADGGGFVNFGHGLATGTGTPGVAAGNKAITISNGTNTASITLTAANAATVATARSYIQSELTAQGVTGVTVGGSGNRIDLAGAADGSNSITVGGADVASVFGAAPGVTAGATAGTNSVDQLVQAINNTVALSNKVRASNDNGKLRIENLSSEDLTVTGIGSDGEIDGSGGTGTVGGNDTRRNLVQQFNFLRDQLDKFADDASFNGINLLRGDKLKLTFNETGTSTIEIQAKDEDGNPTSIRNLTLGIDFADPTGFDDDDAVDARLDVLVDALDTLRAQSSAFGSSLSIVENRQDFTKRMINTLETGAANLTLADTNQEAASLLALQTRQQLSSSALSMASQADQAVLRLF